MLTPKQCQKFDRQEYTLRKRDVFPDITNQDYRYNPKPMVHIPPIGKREFYKRFYSSQSGWYNVFRRRYRCKTACSDDAILFLPKKISKLDEQSDVREDFWGIHACEVVCLRWVLCYNFLCVLPSLVFFIASSVKLGKHFDLQDPSVPLQLTLTMLTMFWAPFLSSLRLGGDHV
jgi:hypothetical protein